MQDFVEDLWDRVQSLSSNGWKVESGNISFLLGENSINSIRDAIFTVNLYKKTSIVICSAFSFGFKTLYTHKYSTSFPIGF